MKYIATTEKVWELLKSNTTEITKVIATDGDYKDTVIEKNIFMENMEFLMESGCLVNCIGWHYDRPYSCKDVPEQEWVLTTVTIYLKVKYAMATEKILRLEDC